MLLKLFPSCSIQLKSKVNLIKKITYAVSTEHMKIKIDLAVSMLDSLLKLKGLNSSCWIY